MTWIVAAGARCGAATAFNVPIVNRNAATSTMAGMMMPPHAIQGRPGLPANTASSRVRRPRDRAHAASTSTATMSTTAHATMTRNHPSDVSLLPVTPSRDSTLSGPHAARPHVTAARTADAAVRGAGVMTRSLGHGRVGRRRRRVRFLRRAYRPDVRNDLPHLVLRNAAAPRRHSGRAALRDVAQQLDIAAAVDPETVAEARTHAAAGASAMTPRAVVLHEQLPPLGGGRRVARIGIVHVAEEHARMDAGLHPVRRRGRDDRTDGSGRRGRDGPVRARRTTILARDRDHQRSGKSHRRAHVCGDPHGVVPPAPDAVCGATAPRCRSLPMLACAPVPSSPPNGTW